MYSKYGFALMILPVTQILHVNLNYYTSYISEVGITWLAQLHQQKYINTYHQKCGTT